MNTRPIKSDSRYTVTREHCGHAQPRYVARFCDEWIGQSVSYPTAVLLATGHRLRRNGATVIVEQPAAHVAR